MGIGWLGPDTFSFFRPHFCCNLCSIFNSLVQVGWAQYPHLCLDLPFQVVFHHAPPLPVVQPLLVEGSGKGGSELPQENAF